MHLSLSDMGIGSAVCKFKVDIIFSTKYMAKISVKKQYGR
jgi:hypothetical protein